MITSVEAYRCGICKGVVVGTLKEAETHERIPVEKIIPRGFVYKPNDLYREFHLVTNPNGAIFRTHGREPGKHRRVLVLKNVSAGMDGLSGGELEYNLDYSWAVGSKHQLSDPEFEEFKKVYGNSINGDVRKMIGLNLSDLTNKL